MSPRKVDARANKVIWRMTMSDPVSVDIDLTAMESEGKPSPDPNDRGWLDSSYELRHGLDVREFSMDRLPDDLFRAFIKSRG